MDAINWALDSPARYNLICAPTGWVKSLGYVAMGIMSGKRTVVLTSTKGLQDQVTADFAGMVTDVRGMQNYKCKVAVDFGFPAYTRVNEALCQAGAGCALRSGGCEYFDDYRRAQVADVVVTITSAGCMTRERATSLHGDKIGRYAGTR